VVERSPEKAGVGGSTPSLATISPKNLVAKSENFQPTINPWFSLKSLREQVNSVSHELFEELALRIPHGFHVGLRVEFHRCAKVLVPQNTLQFMTLRASACWLADWLDV
jgi:hypothetical protein